MNIFGLYKTKYRKIIYILLMSIFLLEGAFFLLKYAEREIRQERQMRLENNNQTSSADYEKAVGYYSFTLPNCMAYTGIFTLIVWFLCNIILLFALIVNKSNVCFRIIVSIIFGPYFILHLLVLWSSLMALYD